MSTRTLRQTRSEHRRSVEGFSAKIGVQLESHRSTKILAEPVGTLTNV